MIRLSPLERVERHIFRSFTRLPAAVLRRLAGGPIERQGRTLDAQVQMGLRLNRLAAKKHPHEQSIAQARRGLEVTALQVAGPRDQPLDIDEATLAGRPVRIYRPHRLEAPAPALLFFHGGGHVVGSLDSHDYPCRELAIRAGCQLLSLDYRLAPEHPFPAAADDATAATRALLEEASSFRVDAARVAVGGDSAGGNLAAVASLDTRDDTRRPRAQLLVYPLVDMTMSSPSIQEMGSGFFLEHETIAWYRDHYIGDANRRDPRASPLLADDLSNLPPALVVTAGFDPLRDEGDAYAERLREVGVEVAHHQHPGLFHGFWNATFLLRSADRALDRAAQWLREAL